MKRIALINFNNHEVYSGMYGLAQIATAIEDLAQVKVIDALREPCDQILKEWKPDIIGVTSYTVHYGDVTANVRKLRLQYPKALYCIGGVHITSCPESLDPVYDFAVIGEAEETMRDVATAETIDDIKQLKGVAFRNDEGEIEVHPREPPKVENIPIPNLIKYTRMENYSNGFVGIIGSRGCPFRCAFCYTQALHRSVRFYPIERVADEVEYCHRKLGAFNIVFWDDVFFLNKNRLSSLIDEFEKRHLLGKVNLHIHMRTSAVDRELCELLNLLNVKNFNCGFESGNDRVLKMVKGHDASVEKHKEAIVLGGEYGINVDGSFIFGMPTETIDEMWDTLHFMDWWAENKERRKPGFGGIWFFVATPLPGTEWWRIAKSKGKVYEFMDWKRLHLHNWKDAFMLEDNVPRNEFDQIHEEAKKRMARINGRFYEA